MILRQEKIPKDDNRLIKIDMDSIEIADHVISFAVLAVTVTKDEEGHYAYGMDLTSPRDEGEESEEMTDAIRQKEENAAEIFIRRALKLALDEVRLTNEKEREAQDKPN